MLHPKGVFGRDAVAKEIVGKEAIGQAGHAEVVGRSGPIAGVMSILAGNPGVEAGGDVADCFPSGFDVESGIRMTDAGEEVGGAEGSDGGG